MYATLDEQSNRSLVRKDFFDIFNIKTSPLPYTLKTCAGLLETAGRIISDFIVESIDGNISLPLPSLLECNQIPNNRTEIPTPDAAFHHSHLRHIAQEIQPLDSDAEIILLFGRSMLQVHKVRKQINGPNNAPFAQILDLGWVVVGDVCLKRSSQAIFSSYFQDFHFGKWPSQLSESMLQSIQGKKEVGC